MARFNKIRQKEHIGKIVYGDGIVDQIIILLTSELENIELNKKASQRKMRTKSIRVIIDKDEVYVDVDVKIHHTQSVSDLAFKIQEAVRHNVESMTEYHVASVNVNVRGVLFDDNVQQLSVAEN